MARTALGAALTQQHLVRQSAIRAAVVRRLLTLWALVDPFNLAGTVGPFAQAGATLVQTGRQESASLAARYIEAFRRAEGVRGLLAVSLAPPPEADAVAGLLRGAGLSGIIKGRERGMTPLVSARNGFVKVSGTATLVVLAGGRDVVTEATAADRQSTGRWQRVAVGGACAFCAMLASRGPAFSARGARFEAHAGCNCSAEPVYEGSELPATSRQFKQEWARAQSEIDVTGTKNDALNAFRRLREGRPTDGRRQPRQSPQVPAQFT